MSALALPALGLAQRAHQLRAGLFADLASREPAADIHLLVSSGYITPGKGAAAYVSDTLCDEALLAAHPRFVFACANDRIFRLLPDGGALSAEQGGAASDGVANDQPAIQAAIDYAEAVGATELRLEAPSYRLDCPPRLSPAQDTRAEDGHPLVVRRSLTIRGCATTRTVLDFRALDGADPESDFQLVTTSAANPSLAVWRGGGVFLQGETPDPGVGNRRLARLELSRLVLKGNRQHTGAYAFPADPITGDGWGVTDKALWLQDCFAGEIVCRETDMTGWKGEIFYLGGAAKAVERVTLHDCAFETSNASAFNPGVDCEIVATDCRFGNCFQAQEDQAKTRATYRNCLWHDCDHMTLGSGATDAVFHTPAYPTRDETSAPPLTRLDDCEFRDIGLVGFASWVCGEIRTVDAPVSLDGNRAMALRDTDLSIAAWLDRKATINALVLNGVSSLTEAVPGAPAGTYKQPPTTLTLSVSHNRTALARANAREWLGVAWTGYIARDCRILVEGETAGGRVHNGGDAPVSMPLVRYSQNEPSSRYWARGWYKLPDIATSGTIVPTAPLMTARMTSGIIADMALARNPSGGAAHGYADAQRIRIVKRDATGTLRFAKGASASFAVRETRLLDNAYDWIEFSYNRDLQRWEEEAYFSDA